jgi:protein-tyrosine-phosphatase
MNELKPHKAERYEVMSRGILPLQGGGISPEMAQILEERENTLSADFVSRKIDRLTILSADLIFTMDEVQRRHVLGIEPSAEGRVFALKKFLPPELEQDIPDPMGQGLEAYEEAYSLIKKAVNELIHWL